MNETDDTHDLENDAVSLLEQKKQEIIATSGGVYAIKEAITAHSKHVDKVRTELQELVSAGKVAADVANFVLGYVGRSSKVLTGCLDTFKSRYDIKTGEALAYDNVVRKVKAKKVTLSQPSAEPEPVVEVESQPTVNAALPPVEEQKKSKGRGKKAAKVEEPAPIVNSTPKTRPDQRGKTGETVARLKQARKSRENKTE